MASDSAQGSPAVARQGHLPRLSPEHYQGLAMVHWTMTLADRAVIHLDDLFHTRVRELLLHATVQQRVFFPAYCLMPDHLHLLAVGTSPGSDQLLAIRFIRSHLGALLLAPLGLRLQKQAFDHVLREEERERGAFQSAAFYILENPVRKGLAESGAAWSFSGCVVPGHPEWAVFHPQYWEAFWRVYAAAVGEERGRATL